jgi:poly-gamma-glutamate capsule biosynthesis protein CapA/YwtB (metallophosphatase superfamily)
VSYAAESGDIRIALTGEAMITRGLMAYREDAFLALRTLLHASDVCFANSEMLFHDFENWPTYLSQTYMRCDPRFIADLQWLGINLVSCANNHGYDYGENGVITNLRNLHAAGLVNAGSGANYAAAMAPAYLETAAGRVGLVSATSSGRANSRAGEQRRDMLGRPGVNLVRWINEWGVDAAAFAQLRRVAERFGWRQRQANWFVDGYGFGDPAPDVEALYFADRNTLGVGSEDLAARFVQDDAFERHSRAFRPDVERNLAAVREARRMADWVIFSVHNHEGGRSVDEPSDHIQALAHAVIDAGADVVIGHGPHVDRGIEVYQGRPIVYSLGNFIMQNDQVALMPQDSMLLWGLGHEHSAADLFDAREASRHNEATEPGPGWWSAVAEVVFTGRRLAELRLHPIELGWGLPRPQTGRPLLARGDIAQRALARFRKLSAPFGVDVQTDGDVGVIRL